MSSISNPVSWNVNNLRSESQPNKPIRFSLILATVGRTDQLVQFLSSLNSQEFRNFELIVIDQNPDDRLVDILTPYQEKFSIKHLRSEKGLSRARNKGLLQAAGEFVAFPDDDCWYAATLLNYVNRFFENNPEWSGLTGHIVDENNKSHSGQLDQNSGSVTKLNIWRRGVSITIFLRASLVKEIGGFDETLGAGAGSLWGCGEETDLLIRAVDRGAKIYYDAMFAVGHPNTLKKIGASEIEKGYHYGMGMGHILRIHQYPIWFLFYWLFRSVGGVLLGLIMLRPGEALFHLNSIRGRIDGWMSI